MSRARSLSEGEPWRRRHEPRHSSESGAGKWLAPMKPRFLPTARQTNWLLCVGFLSVGWALWLRYRAIEFADVSLACQAGLDTWLCGTFRAVIVSL